MRETIEQELCVKNIADYSELTQLVKEFDDCVTPSFSERAGGFVLFVNKLWRNAKCLLLTVQGCPAGLAALYCNDMETQTAFLTFLAIKSPYRGKGLGGVLLAKAEAVAKTENMTKIKLEVYKSNLSAQKFYTKYRYQVCEAESEMSLYMEKRI